MRLSFLSTGTEAGVPVYGCDCPACSRARFDRSARRRPGGCLQVEAGPARLLVGGCPGLPGERRVPDGRLDAILLPDWRPGRLSGLHALRWGVGAPIPLFGPAPPADLDLVREPGLLRPLTLEPLQPLRLGPIGILALPLTGSPEYGYALEHGESRIVWLPGAPRLAGPALQALSRWVPDLLITGADWEEGVPAAADGGPWSRLSALRVALGARRTLITHVSHQLDRWRMGRMDGIPADVEFVRDGQRESSEALDLTPVAGVERENAV
ncbi:hypothetical protein [Thioalbus denitrificans]|uniref:5-phospho-alpha-D-ribosyl 1,2-cyclic phosphate phosphodiesterase n=1 Tax=Thioalbus denitrificans TaxID=547122 RepID=A0A369CAM4_9GAMM|nr:hypothetical protein [Thioalbus denitrificans]RCX30581.1 5-phospho-alpha-D-ribosyl 1,2-cyclic phosphate phosphodiesterase [Thioalbus denitrificans]